MGRAPCCDKANVKKGPWSPEEDAKLKAYIEQHGTGGNWIALPQKIGLKRCGKSCRLRWLNYLRPNIKHGGFTEEEDNIICSLYISIGSRWSIIAAQLPGRTDNDVKNYWNTKLKRKLFGKQRKEQKASRGNNQKQEEIIEGPENFVASDSNKKRYYWPELPIPYSNEEPRFKDHASIRKLLIKLGGRFSDDDQSKDHLDQYLMNNPLTTTKIGITDRSPSSPRKTCSIISGQILVQSSHQQSLNLMPADPIDISSTMGFPSPHTQSNMNGADASTMAAQSSFAAELAHVLYKNPQNYDGLEFLYGDFLNHRSKSISSGTMDWGEMSSLNFPSGASIDECFHKGMVQEYEFDEFMRYTNQQ